MLLKLFLAFTLIPMIELYLLIKIGAMVGVFSTLLIVILTGAAGASLARLQGLHTMLRARDRLQQGEMPAEDMLDGILIFVAGIVLLTPGFLTDIAGLLILLPGPRLHFKRWMRGKLDQWMRGGAIQINRY